MTMTLTVGPATYRANVTPEQAQRIDTLALEQAAQRLATLPSEERDRQALALMREAIEEAK
jgi:hypothetical protein